MRFVKTNRVALQKHKSVGENEMFVQSFLDSGYDFAEVLYDSDYNSTKTQAGVLYNEIKRHFKGLVRAHLVDGRIYLERVNKKEVEDD